MVWPQDSFLFLPFKWIGSGHEEPAALLKLFNFYMDSATNCTPQQSCSEVCLSPCSDFHYSCLQFNALCTFSLWLQCYCLNNWPSIKLHATCNRKKRSKISHLAAKWVWPSHNTFETFLVSLLHFKRLFFLCVVYTRFWPHFFLFFPLEGCDVIIFV